MQKLLPVVFSAFAALAFSQLALSQALGTDTKTQVQGGANVGGTGANVGADVKGGATVGSDKPVTEEAKQAREEKPLTPAEERKAAREERKAQRGAGKNKDKDDATSGSSKPSKD